MAFRGFTRQLQRHGAWFQRVALGTTDDPVYPPLHIKPTAAPTGTAEAGDIYVDASGALQVHNGTSFAEASGNIVVTVPYNAPVDNNIFIADRAYTVVAVRHVTTVVASDVGTVSADIKKCTGTQAPSGGTTVLGLPLNLKATVNTVQTPELTATSAALSLAINNRLALDVTGTTTDAIGVIQVVLRPS